MCKKLLSLCFATIMIVSLIPATYAASDEAIVAAESLCELGLFKGTGTDAEGRPIFDLDRVPTRNEAIIMLIRLLGKENEAWLETWETPFEDVAEWAKPYIGYAYVNGLTSGTSATTYGGDAPITASQYLTFVLRALGYDSSVDFSWDKAWELTDQIGITSGQYNALSDFSRGDMAIVSYSALNVKPKNSAQTLLETIGVVPKKYVILTPSYQGLQPHYKINGKTYSGEFMPELELYEYNGVQYAEFAPSLYIEGTDDVRVEGALIAILALSNNLFEIQNDGNPYTNGKLRTELRPYRSIGMTIKKNREYTSINSYTVTYCYKFNNKVLSTPDFGEGEQILDGVRFTRNSYDEYFVSVDDFLSYFGINKTVTLETDGGITYLVIK